MTSLAKYFSPKCCFALLVGRCVTSLSRCLIPLCIGQWYHFLAKCFDLHTSYWALYDVVGEVHPTQVLFCTFCRPLCGVFGKVLIPTFYRTIIYRACHCVDLHNMFYRTLCHVFIKVLLPSFYRTLYDFLAKCFDLHTACRTLCNVLGKVHTTHVLFCTFCGTLCDVFVKLLIPTFYRTIISLPWQSVLIFTLHNYMTSLALCFPPKCCFALFVGRCVTSMSRCLFPRSLIRQLYHVLGKVCWSSHYPHDILGKVCWSSHYPYDILGKVCWSSHYPYDVLGKVCWPSHYPYDILGKVLPISMRVVPWTWYVIPICPIGR